MNCSEAKNHLSDYIEGLLKGELKKRLKEHLSMCAGCAEQLESLRSLKAALGELEEIETSADFPEVVRKRIDPRRTAGRIYRTLFWRGRLKLPLELAGGLVVVLAVISILTQPAIRSRKGEGGPVAGEFVQVPVEKGVSQKKTGIPGEEFEKIPPGYDEAALTPKNAHAEYSQHEHDRKKAEKQIVEDELLTPSDTASPESQSVAELSPPKEEWNVVELVLLIRPEAVNLFELHRKQDAPPADEEAVESAMEAAPSVKTEEYMEKEKVFMLFNAHEKIRELVVKSNGEVVSSSRNMSGLPQSITAEIPQHAYNKFLDDLSTVGIFERSDLTDTQRGAEMIELAIQFVSTF